MDDSSRKIVTFMLFSAVFALIGHTASQKKSSVGDVTIIIGATIGAALLTLLAQGGPQAEKYAEGLAGITLVSSVLINGVSVFGVVNKLTTGSTKYVAPAPAKVG